MLDRMLRSIAAGGPHSLRGLAQELQVSEALLESMIDELVRMGYLRSASAGCSGECAHCPMAASCRVFGCGRVWLLTEAGRRMADY